MKKNTIKKSREYKKLKDEFTVSKILYQLTDEEKKALHNYYKQQVLNEYFYFDNMEISWKRGKRIIKKAKMMRRKPTRLKTKVIKFKRNPNKISFIKHRDLEIFGYKNNPDILNVVLGDEARTYRFKDFAFCLIGGAEDLQRYIKELIWG